jgi:hypothetical protein
VPQTSATKQLATKTTAQTKVIQQLLLPSAVYVLPAKKDGREKEVPRNVNNVQIPQPTKFGLPLAS